MSDTLSLTTVSTPNTIDLNSIDEMIAHLTSIKKGEYNPDTTKQKILALEGQISTLTDELLKEKATLHKHCRLAQLPLPDYDARIEDTELERKFRIVLPACDGLSGSGLASVMADSRIDAVRIREFQEETFKIKRTGDHSTETKYWLATEAEVKKAQEEADAEVKREEAAEASAKAAERQVANKAKGKGKTKKRK